MCNWTRKKQRRLCWALGSFRKEVLAEARLQMISLVLILSSATCESSDMRYAISWSLSYLTIQLLLNAWSGLPFTGCPSCFIVVFLFRLSSVRAETPHLLVLTLASRTYLTQKVTKYLVKNDVWVIWIKRKEERRNKVNIIDSDLRSRETKQAGNSEKAEPERWSCQNGAFTEQSTVRSDYEAL